MERRKTREVQVGSVTIGGGHPVVVQSMTNTKTEDAAATLAQIRDLQELGCEVIRCAVPTMEAAEALSVITKESPIPVIADIHFDYRLALAAIDAGVSALRLNPGNIGGRDRVEAVVVFLSALVSMRARFPRTFWRPTVILRPMLWQKRLGGTSASLRRWIFMISSFP